MTKNTILIVIFIIIVIGFGYWVYVSNPAPPDSTPQETGEKEEVKEQVVEDETANRNTYTNEKYGYVVKYPSD